MAYIPADLGDDEPEHDHLEGEPLGRGFMLWQITNGWQRSIRAVLAPIGLTYVQVILLAGLKEAVETRERSYGGTKPGQVGQSVAAAGPISQARLAQSLGADVMMTSQVLRSLEAAGLIRRDRNPNDTRARTLVLTDTGVERLRQALPLLEAVDHEFFDALGRKEDRFTRSLRKLWRKRRYAAMGLTAEADARPAVRTRSAARPASLKSTGPKSTGLKSTGPKSTGPKSAARGSAGIGSTRGTSPGFKVSTRAKAVPQKPVGDPVSGVPDPEAPGPGKTSPRKAAPAKARSVSSRSIARDSGSRQS